MNPIRNPYALGAGTPLPQLAGRDELREPARIALKRIRIGNRSKSLMLVGLRGVSKTASHGFFESVFDRSLLS